MVVWLVVAFAAAVAAAKARPTDQPVVGKLARQYRGGWWLVVALVAVVAVAKARPTGGW